MKEMTQLWLPAVEKDGSSDITPRRDGEIPREREREREGEGGREREREREIGRESE